MTSPGNITYSISLPSLLLACLLACFLFSLAFLPCFPNIILFNQYRLNYAFYCILCIFAVLGRFLDVDHLTSMCVQIPKQETVKTAESAISAIICLKHTLELVEPLCDALKETETPLLKAYHEV